MVIGAIPTVELSVGIERSSVVMLLLLLLNFGGDTAVPLIFEFSTVPTVVSCRTDTTLGGTAGGGSGGAGEDKGGGEGDEGFS